VLSILFETRLTGIAKELTDRSVRYMVIGGLAVLLYGQPRLTKDIDITLGLGVDGLLVIKEVVGKNKGVISIHCFVLKPKTEVNRPDPFRTTGRGYWTTFATA
jgi:hypothetical protein